MPRFFPNFRMPRLNASNIYRLYNGFIATLVIATYLADEDSHAYLMNDAAILLIEALNPNWAEQHQMAETISIYHLQQATQHFNEFRTNVDFSQEWPRSTRLSALLTLARAVDGINTGLPIIGRNIEAVREALQP